MEVDIFFIKGVFKWPLASNNRSTYNLVRKRICHSHWSPWSQVHYYKFHKVICKVTTIERQHVRPLCICSNTSVRCKLSSFFFLEKAKSVWTPRRMNIKIFPLKVEGSISIHWNVNDGKWSTKYDENAVYQKLNHLVSIVSIVLFVWINVFLCEVSFILPLWQDSSIPFLKKGGANYSG